MNEIPNVTNLSHEALSVEQKHAPADAVGKYSNQQITVLPRPTSVLAKLETLAEEATFVNRQGERSQWRKQRIEAKKNTAIRGIKIPDNAYMDRVADFNSRHLTDLELKLLASRKSTPELVRRTVGREYKDVTHQLIALIALEKQFENRPELLSAVQEARQQLEIEYGPEVQAGLNVTGDAFKFADGNLDKTQVARDFYRSQVLGYERLSETYKAIVKEYGAASFLPAVDYLLSASGSDLHSESPSISDIQLKPIMDDIKQLQNLHSVYDLAESSIGYLRREYGVALNTEPLELMNFILPLGYDSSFSVSSLEEIGAKLGLADNLQAEISFVTSLTDMTRNLPEIIFRTDNDRQAMIETIEGYSSYLFEKEEAEF